MTDDAQEIEERELDAPAVQKLARSYYAADLGEAREQRWWGFSDEERDALEQIGVTGPLDGRADASAVQTLGKQELRMMDRDARKEAQAEFEATTKRAEGEFQAGLSSLMRRELDASQATLDEIAEIRDKVERTSDENERSALLQKGAALVRSLRDTDDRTTFNPGQVKKTRTYFDGLTRRNMFEETDVHGNSRTSALSRDDNSQQFRDPEPEALPTEAPSVEEFVSWSYDKRKRFASERREQYQALLQATDH